MPDNLKKFISNKNIGLIEKKYNKRSFSYIFENHDEAIYYQLRYGGKIHTLDCNETKAYILVYEDKKKLYESFLPIKELIYNLQQLKLLEMYDKMVANGIKPICVKTDSILCVESKSKLETIFNFENKLGGIRFEEEKKIIDKKIEVKTININLPIQHHIHTIELVNEWDLNEIGQVLRENNGTLIEATDPGNGKTTAGQSTKLKTLFVSPTRVLCQKLRLDDFTAITLYQLLGLTQHGTQRRNMHEYNVSSYEVIVFDELALFDTEQKQWVVRYMKTHDNKKYYATADTDQNEPIKFYTNNVSDVKKYHSDCLDKMFKHKIILKENKRLKNPEDRKKLKEIKKEIFDGNRPVIDTFKRFNFNIIKSLYQVNTNKKVSYFKNRANKINELVHAKQKIHNLKTIIEYNNIKYYNGLELICKNRFKIGKYAFYPNYTFKIIKIDDKHVLLKDISEDDEIQIIYMWAI